MQAAGVVSSTSTDLFPCSLRKRTNSCTLTSWNFLNLLARVSCSSFPRIPVLLHSSLGHCNKGVVSRLVISWNTSLPHLSHEYVETVRRGLTLEERVTIPRRVTRWPSSEARMARTESERVFESGRSTIELNS